MPLLPRALLWIAMVAACGPASVQHVPVQQPTPVSEPEADGATSIPAAVAPPPRPRSAADAPPPFAFEPSIAAAVARIDRSAMERDLAVMVGDRNDLTARPHLEAVSRFVETELVRAAWTVRREAVHAGGRAADNLIAERAGSDPSRVVVVAAHLDSVPNCPGADDDASGLAALIALGRALSSVPTRATIRLVAFAFEEDGVVGSAQHVAALPEPERARIAAVLVMDGIGYRDSRPGTQRYPVGIEQIVHQPLPDTGDFLAAVGFEDEPVLPAMTHAERYVPELRAGVVPLPRWAPVAAPDLMRADHAPFWMAGIPAVMVGDTGNFRNPNYHQPSDRLETIDTEFGTLAARWVGASALTLAGVQ